MSTTLTTDHPRRARLRRILQAAIAVAIAAAALVAAGPAGPANAAPGSTDAAAAQDIARVRRATAAFHSVEAAEAAGYFAPSLHCAELPGSGAMGIHFLNSALIQDPALDLERPEILLYFPSGDGLRLVGVEYFRPDSDQNLATDADRPSLFGRGFNGPMPGHSPGMPVHYDLHVWTWQANPAGVFSDWNSSLSCPA